MRKFSFRPIDVSPWSEEYLFRTGEKVLMLSATILNKEAFCQNLGIKEEHHYTLMCTLALMCFEAKMTGKKNE